MSKPLRDVLENIRIWGGEEGDVEYTLLELQEDAAWDISIHITQHLESMKKSVPKPVFGDTASIENTMHNKVIDDLILDLQEGRA